MEGPALTFGVANQPGTFSLTVVDKRGVVRNVASTRIQANILANEVRGL